MESIRIEQISAVERMDEAAPLLVEHWEEVAKLKHLMVLKPNREMYERLEDVGALISVGAFQGDKMVGYSVSIISTHLHYADLYYANNDVLFVAKEHRAGRLGFRLIKETERIAKERGGRLMIWHAKPGTVLDKIMPRLGYGVQDVLYAKEL